MDDFVVFGVRGSPFVRSVCLALEEKGVAYHIEAFGPGEMHGDAHRKRHPFGRVPVVEHGGYRLYETQAILRYIDAEHREPPLQPTAPQAVGRMNQLIGINDWYLFPQVARIIVFQRIVGPALLGITPDEAAIAAAVPAAELCLGEIGRLLGDQKFMAGDRLSLADLMLAPQLDYLALTPEGMAVLGNTPLLAWLHRMNERPSMQATVPPEPLRKAVSPPG